MFGILFFFAEILQCTAGLYQSVERRANDRKKERLENQIKTKLVGSIWRGGKLNSFARNGGDEKNIIRQY